MADPTGEQLQARFAKLTPWAVPFDGVVYRSSTPRYATESDIVTGEGSRRWGGRRNPIGVAVVYSTLTPETAMAETLASNRYFGEPIEVSMPRTFVAVRAKLKTVLDLRDASLRRRLRLSVAKLLLIDWRMEMYAGHEPLTQTFGRAAHATGWEGMIVPSGADHAGHNLLIFPDRLAAGSRITVMNPDELRGA